MKYRYQTRKGVFEIVPKYERFEIIYEEESLGSYSSPEKAADDLSGGHTCTPSNGIDTGNLGIPDDISEWERIYSKSITSRWW
jgi:hypothetical protein